MSAPPLPVHALSEVHPAPHAHAAVVAHARRAPLLRVFGTQRGPRYTPRVRFAVPLACSALLACASTPATSSTDAGADVATIGCSTDPRAQTYAPALTQVGTQGKLSVELTSAQPAPPLRGTNTWTVRVRDEKGDLVSGASVAVKLLMPDHGHGSTVQPSVTPQSDGSIRIDPLYFFMPGLWQITLEVTAGADTDTAVFTFCVAG